MTRNRAETQNLDGSIKRSKNRGRQDILIACMDGLTGFPEAVRAVFPEIQVQLYIVHMVRNSTKFVSCKDLKKVCTDLKMIYTAATAESACEELEQFATVWNDKYPMIYRSGDSQFGYGSQMTKTIYTKLFTQNFLQVRAFARRRCQARF